MKRTASAGTLTAQGEVGIASPVLYHRLEVQGMEKAVEIYFYCNEMQATLSEIKRNVDFINDALSNHPETDFRNKRILAQIDDVASKCLKLHYLSIDALTEGKNDAKTV